MTKFKVGDVVRVKDTLVGMIAEGVVFSAPMKRWCGQACVVMGISGGVVNCLLDLSSPFLHSHYYWADEWLEEVKEEEWRM